MTLSLKEFFRRISEYIFRNPSDDTSDIEKILQQKDTEPSSISPIKPEEQWDTLYVPPTDEWEPVQGPSEELPDTDRKKLDLATENQSTYVIKGKRHQQIDRSEKEIAIDSLFMDLGCLISEMDIVKTKLDSTESKDIIQFCQERIIECLTKQTIEFLGNESYFNSEIHTPIPFQISPNGTSIIKSIGPGIKKGDKSILKALVEINPS